jgi:hypothetical protein
VSDVRASRLPFGATTKNSEFLEIGPKGVLGIHPPPGVSVDVRATMWKMIVAFPVLDTETLRAPGLRLAEVSWNLVMYQIAVETLFFQSLRSPMCG